MKIWMILIALAEIGGVAGPLPYDMDECLRRADETNAGLRSAMLAKPEHTQENGITPENFFYVCARLPNRPELDLEETSQ